MHPLLLRRERATVTQWFWLIRIRVREGEEKRIKAKRNSVTQVVSREWERKRDARRENVQSKFESERERERSHSIDWYTHTHTQTDTHLWKITAAGKLCKGKGFNVSVHHWKDWSGGCLEMYHLFIWSGLWCFLDAWSFCVKDFVGGCLSSVGAG